MSQARVRQVVEGLDFGEGPRWHDGRLWFSDFFAHRVSSVGIDGDVRVELEWAEWARDASLATADGRRVRHDEIDAALGAWCAVHRGDEVVARLWPAGVPVANVMQPHEQATLPQLKARGYFESVDHAVAGQALHSTMPFRLSGDADRVHRAAAPQLGEHNGEELTRLGLSADEIEGLETVGVIGRVPDAARRAQEKARARAAER